ncbi:MAG TPA: sulfite exporter TauE/SafE family protein [Acidimicrobiia bacterium]|nr:sulfite exporter TauE/SafE family protein [Acidimicrobiia bacterium]
MHVGIGAFLVAATAVSVGSVVQGSVGFGLNLLAAPFVALVIPEALPASLVLVAFPLAVSTVGREHDAVEWRALRWMLLGAVPGTLIGLAIVGVVDATQLAIVVGAVTLSGVALSVLSPPIPVTSGSALTAGFLSNVFGTASSVGGPPVALLFQHRPGPVARSTLGGFFATSAVMSLIGYAATGTITGDQAVFAATLAPFMVGGLWASRHLHPFVDSGWLRPAVLTLSAIAGAAAIARGVL